MPHTTANPPFGSACWLCLQCVPISHPPAPATHPRRYFRLPHADCAADDEGSSGSAPTLSPLGGARWALRFTPARPGAFELRVQADQLAPLVLPGEAVPAGSEPAACELRLGGGDRLPADGQPLCCAAGKPLPLALQRRDAAGRPVGSHAGERPVRGAGEGPGPMEVAVKEGAGGVVSVAAVARLAGRYRLRLWMDGPEGALPVGGSPLDVEVKAGEVAQQCCSFTLEVSPPPPPTHPFALSPCLRSMMR